MCKFKKPYAEALRAGEIFWDEIDDYVEYWHTHDTGNSLQDFLGMTKDEFVAWVKNDNRMLPMILGIKYEIPTCKICGCKMGVETSVGIIMSSCYIGTDTCFECQVEHCLSTNCLKCEVGQYPDCEHLDLKKCYMEEERVKIKTVEDGKFNES